MFKINKHLKGIEDYKTEVPSGFQMTFENGNTISVQFGFGNYCENRDESKESSSTAEVAIWNKEGKWYRFPENNDEVVGWKSPDEVAELIHFTRTTDF